MTNTAVKTIMEFDVSARDLWDTITNPSHFKKWYFHIPHFTTTVGESFDFYEITGDMVNWLAKNKVPAISVLLSTHNSIEWDKNLAGIKALLEHYAK